MKKGIDIIKEFVAPVLEAAYCAHRQEYYIGYGQTLGVYNGLAWSEQQTEDDLQKQVADIKRVISHNFGGIVTGLQEQALISFIHGIGTEEFLRSDVAKHLKNKKYKLAANGFLQYNRVGRVASVRIANRRKKEQLLFLEGTIHE
jgi:lysozyme